MYFKGRRFDSQVSLKNRRLKYIVYETSEKYYISTICECIKKKSMINI